MWNRDHFSDQEDLPARSGRRLRLFDVLVALVLGAVVFTQYHVYQSMQPEQEPPAPVAMTGPLAALPAKAVAAPVERLYVGKPKAVKKRTKRYAKGMVISPSRLASQRVKKLNLGVSTKGKAIHLPGGKNAIERPKDEFVPELNPALAGDLDDREG